MPIFIAIAIVGFVYLLSSLIFGGHDHDHDVDHDHDAGHDHGHDGQEGAISVFSPKVIATLLMAFGVTGAFARYNGSEWPAASAYGAVSGLVFGMLIWGLLSVLYKQQANSMIDTRSTVGQLGTVVVSIGRTTPGQVGLTVQGMYRTYDARSTSGAAIPRGRPVKVVGFNGGELVVEEKMSSAS
jgi:membrane protein implicated in regulation of membrane protease activity